MYKFIIATVLLVCVSALPKPSVLHGEPASVVTSDVVDAYSSSWVPSNFVTSYSNPLLSSPSIVPAYSAPVVTPVISSYSAPVVSSLTSPYTNAAVHAVHSAPLVHTYSSLPSVVAYKSAPLVHTYAAHAATPVVVKNFL